VRATPGILLWSSWRGNVSYFVPPGTHPPGGALAFAQVRARSPEGCGHRPCQGPAAHFPVSKPAGGTSKRCRSRLHGAAGGWLHLPVLGRGLVAGGALLLQPGGDAVVPVAHGAPDAEAVRSGAEVTPAAQGGDRGARDVGDFGDGEQFVVYARTCAVRWSMMARRGWFAQGCLSWVIGSSTSRRVAGPPRVSGSA
jgi:hypothetical protein